MPELLATIGSQTAALTVVVFDAVHAAEWVPTKAAATKAQFTGHPAEVMRLLAKGEDVAEFDVGASHAFAFELEGRSGKLELYRVSEGVHAMVAPPRAWWLANGAPAGDLDALFAEALAVDGADDEAVETIGELELGSGKLAAVYLWHKKVGAARELASTLSPGGAAAFGDGYGATENGAVADLGVGTVQLRKRELEAPWDAEQSLVVMYLTRT